MTRRCIPSVALLRNVWRGFAESGWRATSANRALEVRLQEHQSDRAYSVCREAALDTWNISAPSEYGFYSNVNPNVDHPRWSQAKERRLGEFLKRPTLMFNGYGDQVASLYSGMDLKKIIRRASAKSNARRSEPGPGLTVEV